MSGLFRQIAIVAFTALMLFTNVILGSGSFSSDAAFDRADSIYYLYQTPLTPAVFTFIIWGPIFLGVCAIAVLQALPHYRHTDALNRFAPFYCGALIANAATPFTPIGWGLLAVVALLVCLVASYQRLSDGADRIGWVFRVPVALFGTWALIATFVNFGQVVVAFGGSINAFAAAGLLAIAMGIGAYAIWRTREAVIFAVMLWAGVGIAVKQSDLTVLLSAIVVTTVVNAAVTWLALKKREAAIV